MSGAERLHRLAVAFSHDEVEAAQDGDDVAHHVAGQKFAEDAEIDEGGRANFQAVRHAAALALDIEAELALRIFRAEIDFADRRLDAFGDEDELVNQFLHFGEHLVLVGQEALAVADVDRAAGQRLERLLDDADALAQFLEADKIAVVGVADGAGGDVEIVLRRR